MVNHRIAEDTVDLRVYGKFLAANWWRLVLFALLGGSAAFLIADRQPAVYEAHGEIVLVRESQPIANVRQDLTAFSPWDETFVYTHTRLIGSEALVASAVSRLQKWAEDGGSQTNTIGANFPANWRQELGRWIKGKSSEALAAEVTAGLFPEFIRKSRILQVQMRSRQPVFAAAAVEALAASYAATVADMSISSTDRLFARLQAERDEAARRRETAANALLDFKRTAEVEMYATSGSISDGMSSNQVAGIRNQLAMEDADGASLLAEMAGVLHEIETTAQRYGDKHPEMKALVEKRETLQVRLKMTTERLYQQWQLRHVRERIKAQQDVLEGELESCRQLHDLILTKLKEVDLSGRVSDQSVLTLKKPQVPTRPVSPRKTRDTAMGTLAGVCAGLLLGLVRQFRRNLKVSVEHIGTDLSVKIFGQIPLMSKSAEMATLLSGSAPGGGTEAVPALRTAVVAQLQAAGAHVVQITSPGTGDGKSTLAAALARSLALAGKRTLLMDLDLRCGQQHRLFSVLDGYGLADVLRGDEVRPPTEVAPNLWVYTSGEKTVRSSELIAGERLGAFLAQLSPAYDVIVIDSPPLLALTDAALLAGHAGVRLLVARSGFTHRRACRDSALLLQNLGQSLHGVILNGVRPDEHDGYYYYYRYSRYQS